MDDLVRIHQGSQVHHMLKGLMSNLRKQGHTGGLVFGPFEVGFVIFAIYGWLDKSNVEVHKSITCLRGYGP